MKTSFASHPKAIYWSKRNVGNPEDYALNSHKKCWFDCVKCGHEFNITLNNVNSSDSWCPYCANKKICGKCKSCFNKSFASHPKSVYWSNENNIKPEEAMIGSEKKYYFNCDKCSHKMYISLKKISSQGRWCAYCAHHKLCENNSCDLCFNNSFASIERSKFLSDKTLNPRMIFKSTSKKYNFNCDRCNNSFDKILSDITNGVWCPYCFNKTEEKLFNELIKHYNVKRQFRVDWCKNPKTNKYLPYDFVIEDLNIIVEQDGPQHFKQIGNWQEPKLTKNNDIYKMKCANDNGFSIIRILQKDVWHDRYDWLKELLENIAKIVDEKVIQNIYMCKKDEYKDFDIIE